MKLVFTDILPVRARDIDIFDHVNNSVYLTYMEESRWNWLLHHNMVEKIQDGLAIVEAKLEFKKPIHFPNNIKIETYVHPPSRTSFTIHHKISLEKKPEEICTTADIKIVFFDLNTKRAIPIPDNFRKLLE